MMPDIRANFQTLCDTILCETVLIIHRTYLLENTHTLKVIFTNVNKNFNLVPLENDFQWQKSEKPGYVTCDSFFAQSALFKVQ